MKVSILIGALFFLEALAFGGRQQPNDPIIVIEGLDLLANGSPIRARVDPSTVRVRRFVFKVNGKDQACGAFHPFDECTLEIPDGLPEVAISVVAYVVGRDEPIVRTTVARVFVSVHVPKVQLWGRVYRENKVVEVDPGQLQMWDNGVEVHPDCSRKLGALHVVLAVDGSGSMQRHLPVVREQLHKFIAALEPTDSVTLLNFDRSVTELTKRVSPQDAVAVLDQLRAGGQTALWDGVRTSTAKFSRGLGNFMFLLTDGDDQISAQLPETVARSLSRADTVLFVSLLPGGKLNTQTRENLRRIAQRTSGDYGEVNAPGRLAEQLQSQLAGGREMFTCSFDPEGEPDDTWHTLTVRVAGRSDLTPNFRPQYFSQKGK